MFERVYDGLIEDTGAVIMGRRTYDNSIPEWGGSGPIENEDGGVTHVVYQVVR